MVQGDSDLLRNCQILETEIKVSLLIRAPDFHSPAAVAPPHYQNGSYYCSWTRSTTPLRGLQQPTSFFEVSLFWTLGPVFAFVSSWLVLDAGHRSLNFFVIL